MTREASSLLLIACLLLGCSRPSEDSESNKLTRDYGFSLNLLGCPTGRFLQMDDRPEPVWDCEPPIVVPEIPRPIPEELR